MERIRVFKSISFFILTILLLTATGCETLLYPRKIEGNYYVIETDLGHELGYQVNEDGDFVTLIGSEIFDVGYNKKFIVANRNGSYFIVPVYAKYTYSPEIGIIGPLNKEQLILKEKDLAIHIDLTFNTRR